MLLDIHKLQQGTPGNKLQHKFVKCFKTFKDLLKSAENSSDPGLHNKIKVRVHHQGNVMSQSFVCSFLDCELSLKSGTLDYQRVGRLSM